MSFIELLSELKSKDVHLYLDRGALRGKFPPGVLTPSLKASLQTYKAELTDYLLQAQWEDTIEPAGSEQRNQPPLSYAQERLWFLGQFDPGSAFYNMSGAIRLHGELDVAVLQRALKEIVRRHEVLRTTFEPSDGVARQIIHPAWDWHIPVADLSAIGVAEQVAAVQRHLQAEADQPFDLAQGPLVRASLLFLGKVPETGMPEHILMFTLHHIVSDGWSTAILIREFMALYTAYRNDTPSPLTELTIQYVDYAVWQRQWLQGDKLEQHLQYWRQHLTEAPPVLELPLDRPRPAVQSYRGTSHLLTITPALTERLKVLGRQQDATLFMVLLAAFNVLLSRHSGQQDICIGTPVANRNRLEIEGLIGFFVNTLVLRCDLSGNPTFLELLQRVRDVCLGAQAHQDLPFEKLVEELAPVRDMSHNPLFQVMLSLQNVPEASLEMESLRIEPLSMETHTSKFDLDLNITERPTGLEVQFNYNTDLFDAATIERMAEHYRTILEDLSHSPGQRLNTVRMLPPAEWQQLMRISQGTVAFYPQGYCIHELFEAQVERDASRVAVVLDAEWLSYGELNRQANRLAHALRQRGVGAETVVGICMERSLEMVVALLGILKSGGAYLPIDPELPRGRLRQIVQDANATWMLTQTALVEGIPSGCQTLCLDRDIEWQTCDAQNFPERRQHPDQLAYLLYTSGTTGVPKGVAVSHYNLVNQYHAWETAYALQADDVHLQMARYTFDVFAGDWIRALCSGAKLVICPRDTLLQSSQLHALIERERITVAEFVPAVLRLLTGYLDDSGQRLDNLRLLICGSDRWHAEDYRRLVGRCNDRTRLINSYGLTETTIDSTYFELAEPTELVREGVPIGHHFANTQTYILDRWLNPAPVGVPGELYIGGAGVARGYLQRPGLTAERFIPDPIGGESGARLYKTGDIVRYLPDGNIEHLGRADHQVKIRGLRIEPGEIEATLLQHEYIREAVVVARTGAQAGEQQLVAYVVGDEAKLGIDTLRRYLQEYLADYMVPSVFVLLDALPLTANGKLDRKALPEPQTELQRTTQYVAPRNALEHTLAGIWAEVLGVERVGIHDNFFELGGHSLLAMVLVDRMRKHGLPVSVRSIFIAQTLSELTTVVDSESMPEVPANRISVGSERITPDMLPLVSLSQDQIDRIVDRVPGGVRNVRDIYPLTPFQEGILFHHLVHTEGDPYLQSSLLAFSTRQNLDDFVTALQKVMQRHDILRTAVMWEDLPEPIQVVLHEAVLPVREIEINANLGDTVEQLRVLFDPRHYRLDIRQAPLLKCYVAHDPAQSRWLMMILEHHLALDHVAMETLLKEVYVCLTGQVERLPEPLPFRNFVARVCLDRQQEQQESFFRELLGRVTEPTAPFGLLESQGNGFDAGESEVTLNASLAWRIRTCAQAAGVSAASLFHLAWARVLAQVSGNQTVVFGTVLFGRMLGDAWSDRMLGMFINTLPVCMDVARQGVRVSLQRMHNQLIGLMQYEHAPLALALRCSGVPAPTPLFSALLNYRHSSREVEMTATEQASLWSGLGITVLAEEDHTHYPLVLSIDDFGDAFRLTLQIQSSVDPEQVCNYVQTALSELVDALQSDPDKPLCELNILPEPERLMQLTQWSTFAPELPLVGCLHQRFEVHARQSPNAVALVFDGLEMTYGQLNVKANRLAHYLRSRGVDSEHIVGLCVERSFEMLIGILGILKAGGAYLPIDPNYPKERISFMIGDAAPYIVLTQEIFMEGLPEGTSLFCLDRDATVLSDFPDIDPKPVSTPLNLAYVIYTSGSTGKPKGVWISHFNAMRLFAVTEQEYAFDASDVWTLFHSFAFDFSVWEIWGALMYGGRLVVVPYWVTRSPEAFHDLVVEQGVTVLNQTPTSFFQFDRIDQSSEKGPLALRWVIFGGEELELGRLQNWFLRHGDDKPKLVNMYGITETTVHVTWVVLKQADTGSACSVIGKPLVDLQTFILDTQGNLVPIGVAGELYVGGAGVARGYLNRPDLTAERFVPSFYGINPGERLYRTGDVARYRHDGTLEYLGRIDHQIKIRGFRIELGEIEGMLMQHDQIKTAIVIAREDDPGEKRLVAYIVAPSKTDANLNTETVRAYLQTSLPDYMIPSAFVFLDELPITLNGKVDRKLLPAPDMSTQQAIRYVAPRNPTEEILASIWANVLGLEGRVGIDDNFFSLGGDSIRSIQLSGLARERGLVFPLEQLFKSGTIRALAHVLDDSNPQCEPYQNLDPFALLSQEDRAQIPEDIEDAYPLTELQAGMIFHSELEPGAYHVVDSVGLHCMLDLDMLQQAFERVFMRHPILRTSFDLGNFSEPLQLVHRECTVPLLIKDLRQHSPALQEQALSDHLTWAQQHYLDISKPPLLQLVVHCLADDRFQLSIIEHHAILDGWSLVSFLVEVLQRYDAMRSGLVFPEKAVSNAMRNLVLRERQALHSEADKAFWKSQLNDAKLNRLPELLPNIAPDVSSVAAFSQVELRIPVQVSRTLQQVAQSLAVPLKSLLLAVHMRVLCLLHGENSITTGLTTSVRPEELDGDQPLGLFLNTLPFSMALRGGTWAQLILQVFNMECELLRARFYPLAGLQRLHNGVPLFETTFNYLHYHLGEDVLQASLIKVTEWKESIHPNYTLETTFNLEIETGDIHLLLEADQTRLVQSQLMEIGQYYCRALTHIAEDVSQRYEFATLLNDVAWQQLMRISQGTVAFYPQGYCIHELFEAQVERDASRVAVVLDAEWLSYGELNRQANRLAHALRQRGVGAETVVGICMERSLEMVVALLGILKSGGAYLPIDPELPRGRLRQIVQDANATWMLTQTALVEGIPSGCQTLCLDRDIEWQTCDAQNFPERRQHPDQLAYLLYTSGTTGVPKGVAVSHYNLVNQYHAWETAYALQADDVHLQMARYTFDVFAGDWIRALCSGAKLVICPRDTLLQSSQLHALIERERITVAEFVPAVLRLLTGYLDDSGQRLDNLRLLICGSDRWHAEDYRRLVGRCNDRTRLINSYGLTETTIDSTYFELAEPTELVREGVPIGHHFANTQTYILDRWLNPAPVGVPGELYIGGAGVARGYLQRPGLTAERFIPDPIGGESGARLYKTGDIVRYLPDGNIEHLGRADHQVKIRGLRIEPGEIEATLLQHEYIREAVVVARTGAQAGEQQLVAYVVGDEAKLGIDTLRRYLQEYLADYMVPSVFVLLDALPLTANGKLDRKALPEPQTELQRTTQYVAPRNALEHTLAGIWAEVLGVERVGIHDNFFELGGHSLLAVQVIARVRIAFAVDLSLGALLSSQTIELVARDLEEAIFRSIEALSESEAEYMLQAERH